MAYPHFIVFLMIMPLFGGSKAQLDYGFYINSCPNVIGVSQDIIAGATLSDARLPAKIIRLYFHDCFVGGCDASILLDNSIGIESEKDTPPNSSIGGLEVVDDIKTALEIVCPGIVSCADILTIAAQVSVFLAGGPSYEVKLGRRDSLTAFKSDVLTSLPGINETVGEMEAKFAKFNLNTLDLVALSGAHTLGIGRCVTFIHRLYNFDGNGNPDGTIEIQDLTTLRNICPEGGNPNVFTDLDPITPNIFDNNYYINLQNGHGLLRTDQVLLSSTGEATVPMVNAFAASQSTFFDSFVQSMLKLGDINPLIGTNGEVRSNCRFVN